MTVKRRSLDVAAPRPSPGPRSRWRIDGSVAAYALIGAALYGVLGLFSSTAGPAVIRPGFALVPFLGYVFGPVVGFASGFIGQGILEQIGGISPEGSWIHGVASGLIGLVAGLAPLYVPRLYRGTLLQRAGGGAVAAVLGALAGALIAFVQGGGTTFADLVLMRSLPIAIVNAAIGALIVPILVYLWEPLAESMAS